MDRSILDLLSSEVRGQMRQSVLLKILNDVRRNVTLANTNAKRLVKKHSKRGNAGAAFGTAL